MLNRFAPAAEDFPLPPQPGDKACFQVEVSCVSMLSKSGSQALQQTAGPSKERPYRHHGGRLEFPHLLLAIVIAIWKFGPGKMCPDWPPRW